MTQLLLVEDDERVRHFILRGLEAEGYAVAVAPDGPQGLSRGTAEPFDVMILDVMLPGMNGKDVCRRLREASIPTPILMLTALDHTEDKVSALRGGADDYLTKPFDFDELLARIEALVRRKKGFSAEPASVLEIGGVRIERASMRVLLRGQPVELTAKEYQLLDLLMSNPHKVFSRTRILNKVWGYDSDPLTNIVDVYIRRLRSKMQWDCEKGWIRTVRNYGYRLDPDSNSDLVTEPAEPIRAFSTPTGLASSASPKPDVSERRSHDRSLQGQAKVDQSQNVGLAMGVGLRVQALDL